MTETSPIGLVSRLPPEADALPEAERYKLRAKQGVSPPLVELRVRHQAGDVPHDGTTSGELLAPDPWIAGSYVESVGERSDARAVARSRSAGPRHIAGRRCGE